jgi:hypothetical protein
MQRWSLGLLALLLGCESASPPSIPTRESPPEIKPTPVTRDAVAAPRLALVIVVDGSRSMLAPWPTEPGGLRLNRFEALTDEILFFLRRLREVDVGLILFGRDPVVVAEVSPDLEAVRQRISLMPIDLVDGSVTAIGPALELARKESRPSNRVVGASCSSPMAFRTPGR